MNHEDHIYCEVTGEQKTNRALTPRELALLSLSGKVQKASGKPRLYLASDEASEDGEFSDGLEVQIVEEYIRKLVGEWVWADKEDKSKGQKFEPRNLLKPTCRKTETSPKDTWFKKDNNGCWFWSPESTYAPWANTDTGEFQDFVITPEQFEDVLKDEVVRFYFSKKRGFPTIQRWIQNGKHPQKKPRDQVRQEFIKSDQSQGLKRIIACLWDEIMNMNDEEYPAPGVVAKQLDHLHKQASEQGSTSSYWIVFEENGYTTGNPTDFNQGSVRNAMKALRDARVIP